MPAARIRMAEAGTGDARTHRASIVEGPRFAAGWPSTAVPAPSTKSTAACTAIVPSSPASATGAWRDGIPMRVATQEPGSSTSRQFSERGPKYRK